MQDKFNIESKRISQIIEIANNYYKIHQWISADDKLLNSESSNRLTLSLVLINIYTLLLYKKI